MKSLLINFFRKLILSLLILLSYQLGYAQFQVNNNASDLGGGYFQLTQALNNQAGSVWYKLQHDLNDPFTVEGQMNFGSDPAGADGIAFVMQNNCLAAGTAGGGIGYKNMPGQSFIVEFDTWQNASGSGDQNNHDPAYDHVSVMKNGNPNHLSDSNLIGPFPMLTSMASVKTGPAGIGTWYDFKITYNPTTNLLEVYFNNVLRVSYTYDIRNQIFGGNQYVYWGFTSSTGGFNNDQRLYINKALTTFVLRDTTICTGSVNVELPPLTKFKGTNIALNKSAVSSSNENGGALPVNAVDGNLTTRWSSQFSDPQWIYIDLSSPHDIDSVKLNWEGAFGREYKIQYSTDAVSWTDAFHETNGNGGWDLIVAPATDIRYVRMYGIQRATGYGYSLWEFQIYGMPKYIWSPNDGSIDNIYSNTPTFSPAATTNYTVIIPDPCTGAVTYNYRITVDCSILPVELVSFNASLKNGKGFLDWQTSSEINSKEFVIMKSTDGSFFYPIGVVPAKGNSSVLVNYNFIDQSFTSGTAYYYLLQVDNDGSETKSQIKSINQSLNDNVTILPTIFQGSAYVITSGDSEWLSIKITNVIGQEFSNDIINNPSGKIEIGASLPAGFYIISVAGNGFSKVFKVKKERE